MIVYHIKQLVSQNKHVVLREGINCEVCLFGMVKYVNVLSVIQMR